MQDFSESLLRVTLPSPPETVIRSWGESSEGKPGCEWSGGFVMRLQNGTFAYLSGWCDYTGWGCRHGARVTTSTTLEGLDLKVDHQEPPDESSWDEQPADLNRWIARGMPGESEMYDDIGKKS